MPTIDERYSDPLEARLRMREKISLLPQVANDKKVPDAPSAGATIDTLLWDEAMSIEGTPSELAEALLYLNRKPFSLKKRDYLRWVYDVNPDYPVGSRNVLLIAGRQTEKSTTLAAKSMVMGAANPAFDTLLIEPRDDQVKVFSQQRFQPMAEESEFIKKVWMSTKMVWQVHARQFLNGSFFNFRSCYYSADPVRGITANNLMVDELQDIISDNIPILEECQSHIEPDMRYQMFAGTPKTTSNTLNLFWKDTCQFEWMVRCGCRNWNYLDEKVIGKKSYICTQCGKQLYPLQQGRWVAMRPSRLNNFWGFRISQIMVPFMRHSDILRKMEDPNRPRVVFFNECLGLPYDQGQLVLTRDDIAKACEKRSMDDEGTIWRHGHVFMCAGVDHGTGDYAPVNMATGQLKQSARRRTSFTALAFGGFDQDNIFRVYRIFKFTGQDSNLATQPGVIDEYVRTHGAKWIMSDGGFGAQTNARLTSDYDWVYLEDGSKPLLMVCLYAASKSPVKWNPQAFCYIINRNFAIEKTVDAIKKGEIKFFNLKEMDHYIDDFTSMYVEYDFNRRSVKYDHILPDDCFQAVVYCYLAALQRRGRLAPTIVPNVGWD